MLSHVSSLTWPLVSQHRPDSSIPRYPISMLSRISKPSCIVSPLLVHLENLPPSRPCGDSTSVEILVTFDTQPSHPHMFLCPCSRRCRCLTHALGLLRKPPGDPIDNSRTCVCGFISQAAFDDILRAFSAQGSMSNSHGVGKRARELMPQEHPFPTEVQGCIDKLPCCTVGQ